MQAITQEVKDSFDNSAKVHMDEQLAPEMAKQQAEYQQMQADQESARLNTDAQIVAETENVRQLQENAQQRHSQSHQEAQDFSAR